MGNTYASKIEQTKTIEKGDLWAVSSVQNFKFFET